MKRTAFLAVLIVMLVAGCQRQHEEDKKLAMERWNQSRLQIMMNMADEQFRANQLQKATDTVRDALAIDQDYIPAHLLLGQIYLEQNQLIPAQREYEQCLALDPSSAPANYNLGVISEKFHQIDQALDYYQKAWETQPEHVPYILAMVETLVTMDRREQAYELVQNHIANKSYTLEDASLYVAGANILLSLNQPEEAVALFRRAAALSPENEVIRDALAFALVKSGHYGEAVAMLEQIKEKAEKDGKQINWSYELALGDCYLELGQFFKAQRCFERVCEADSNNPTVWMLLGKVALARNDIVRAKQHSRRALALNSAYTDAKLILAYACIRDKDYEQAEKVLQGVLDLEKDNGLVYCLMGQVYESQGNDDKALQCYRSALDIDPTDSLASDLAENLKKIHLSQDTSTTSN